ncbi:MAG: hypothetical protein AAGI28_09120 [Pseudomonadota bacterium]
MSTGKVRGIVIGYMIAFLLATTWPGAMLFSKSEPLVMGLPFSLFFIAALILIALALLALLYLSETRSPD